MRDGGKGDRQRPLGVDEETFANNWDQIFKKAKELVKDVEIPDLDKPLPKDKDD